jgi:Flp pilus assembly protein TadD
VEELAQAAELDPTNPSIAAELGGAHEDQGEMTSALAAFLHAAELAPREAAFWRLLAEFSLRNEIEVRQVGIPAARNAYALAPDAAACDNLAMAHFLSGDLVLAERFLRRALALDRARPETQYHLGLLFLERDQVAAARAAFETAARLDPEGAIGELATRTLEGLR